MYRSPLLFLLISLVVFLSACDEVTTPKSVTRIAVVGDSISDGVNPQTAPAKYGWVQMIAAGGEKNAALRAIRPDAVVDNFSISGSTAAGWNSTAALAGAIAVHPQVAVVYLGGNDVLQAVNSGGFTEAAATTLSNNIQGIVVKLESALTNVRLVLLGYYDLFDNRSSALAGVSGFGQYSTMSDHVLAGNTMLSNIARLHQAVFVPIREVFLGHAYGEDLGGTGMDPEYFRRPMSAFDIHPITAGHAKIADQLLEALQGVDW